MEKYYNIFILSNICSVLKIKSGDWVGALGGVPPPIINAAKPLGNIYRDNDKRCQYGIIHVNYSIYKRIVRYR